MNPQYPGQPTAQPQKSLAAAERRSGCTDIDEPPSTIAVSTLPAHVVPLFAGIHIGAAFDRYRAGNGWLEPVRWTLSSSVHTATVSGSAFDEVSNAEETNSVLIDGDLLYGVFERVEVSEDVAGEEAHPRVLASCPTRPPSGRRAM